MPAETRRALRAGIGRYAAWAEVRGHGLPATGEALTECASHLAYGLGLAPGHDRAGPVGRAEVERPGRAPGPAD